MFFTADKETNRSPHFKKGDLAYTKIDLEKVVIMKEVEPGDKRNKDLGPCYLVRQGKSLVVLYEIELFNEKEGEALIETRKEKQ